MKEKKRKHQKHIEALIMTSLIPLKNLNKINQVIPKKSPIITRVCHSYCQNK